MNRTPINVEVAVIGAGTAGLNAFNTLRRARASCLLIDRGPLGTTCARVGCMPSKAVLHAGRRWADFHALARIGRTSPAVSPDHLWRHARATRDRLVRGAAERTVASAGEQLLRGQARFIGPDTLDVEGRRVTARAFVVATGSRPVVPPSLASLGPRLLTTDSLFELEVLPRSIGILGLGAAGLEMGLALSRLGAEVVAGDLKAAPAGISDPLIAARAVEIFSTELPLWLGQALEAAPVPGGVSLRSDGQEKTVDLLLAALGRRPDLEGLALEEAGVQSDARGQVRVDPQRLRCGDSRVFLAGDASPDRALMHEAADEGAIAAHQALALARGEAAPAWRRRTPLSIVFSDPDIAAVGAGFDTLDPERVVVGTGEGAANGRSRILGAESNLVRVYAERDSGRLLGAGLISTGGEHLAHLLAWSVQRGETVQGLLEMPFYHPSVEELLQSALKDAMRQLPATGLDPAGLAAEGGQA